MPFDDIVWHGFLGSDYADRGDGESSNAIDVRFGQTQSEDSHSTFSWPGYRRFCMAPFKAIALRLQNWPYADGSWSTFANNRFYPQTEAWSQNQQNFDFEMGEQQEHVFGWPDISALDGEYSARLYSTSTVNGMDVNDLNGNAGYPVGERGDLSATDNHSTLVDHLFQAQNREGCHQLSTSANIYNITNPFIGIHSSFPLKIVTTKNYKGYRLVLKRTRYIYNQTNMNLSDRRLPTFETSWQTFWGRDLNFYRIGQYYNHNEVNAAGLPQGDIERVIAAMFCDRFIWPRNAGNVAVGVDPAIDFAGTDTWQYEDPVYWSSNGWVPGAKGTTYAGEIPVSDAVIHRTIVPRQQIDTGSVNIKNITIKKNDNVLKAKDDVLGPWVEVPRTSIYSLGKASTAGATLTFASYYSNISNASTTKVDRYVAAGFQIKFSGDDTWYKITAASKDGATLSQAPSKAKSSVEFTLRVPRGSPNSDYTWGNYKLSVFDEDNSINSSCANIRYEHLGSEANRWARFLTPLSYDLFQSTGSNANNGNETIQGVYNQARFNPDFPTKSSGKAVRHPHFGNELGESLFLTKDYSMAAYWDRFRLGTANSGLGHISTDIGAQSISWDNCAWVTYYEHERAVAGSGAGGSTGFTGMKSIVLDLSFLNFIATEKETYNSYSSGPDGVLGTADDIQGPYDNINLDIRSFMFGGLDPVSGSIWPSYKINLASFSPGFFAQNFSTRSGQWTNFFQNVSAYGTANVAENLDKAWYVFCAHEKDSALNAFYVDTQYNFLTPTIVAAFSMQRMFGTGAYTNDRATSAISREMVAKQVKTLLHPWVLASYGFDYDQLGWGGEMANELFHTFTIYDSDEKIRPGTTFEVSLHQAGIPFQEENINPQGRVMEGSVLLGLGTAMIPVDNYQLYIVAK